MKTFRILLTFSFILIFQSLFALNSVSSTYKKIENGYDIIASNPNSKHGLKEYLSRRGELNLESFHLMLAHFGNTGM